MPEPDFWTTEAEAMELTLAGTRLIVREISDYAKQAWRALYVKVTVTAGKGGNDTVA